MIMIKPREKYSLKINVWGSEEYNPAQLLVILTVALMTESFN